MLQPLIFEYCIVNNRNGLEIVQQNRNELSKIHLYAIQECSWKEKNYKNYDFMLFLNVTKNKNCSKLNFSKIDFF